MNETVNTQDALYRKVFGWLSVETTMLIGHDSVPAFTVPMHVGLSRCDETSQTCAQPGIQSD